MQLGKYSLYLYDVFNHIQFIHEFLFRYVLDNSWMQRRFRFKFNLMKICKILFKIILIVKKMFCLVLQRLNRSIYTVEDKSPPPMINPIIDSFPRK